MCGVAQLQVSEISRARLAFAIALRFLFAGFYYRQQKQ
jgi:hypothetical protein